MSSVEPIITVSGRLEDTFAKSSIYVKRCYGSEISDFFFLSIHVPGRLERYQETNQVSNMISES